MPAPKYNLFTLGNNGGRPRVYANAEDLQKDCENYFTACVTDKMVVTITGLCLWLGISRATLIRWQDEAVFPEFSTTIKRAVLCVEQAYEYKLDTFTFGGAIFALKNINKEHWKDKTEQEVNQIVTNVAAAFGGTLSAPQEPSTDTP